MAITREQEIEKLRLEQAVDQTLSILMDNMGWISANTDTAQRQHVIELADGCYYHKPLPTN